MGYTVTGLTQYVETNKDVLIKNLVLGLQRGDTIRNCRKQLGIKTKERLNYLDVDPVLQDGSNCGFSASGSTAFSERDIETAQFKAQDQYCDKDLLNKFTQYAVKISADKDASDMPFEAEIMNEIVEKINEKMEKLVWQGDKTGNSDLIDGFLTIALNADSASTITVTGSSATSMYARVQATIMAIPEEWLDKAVVFMSPASYRKLLFELVEKNLYHFPVGAEIEDKDVYFPGSEVRIHKTLGLKGVDMFYTSIWDNMVYGADLENDQEKIRFWYDDNSELYKYSIHWNAGVSTLYPDAVIVSDFSA